MHSWAIDRGGASGRGFLRRWSDGSRIQSARSRLAKSGGRGLECHSS